MKKDYTRAELQAEMTALQQIFDSVTVADPFQGLLDPATLQPLNKVATIPVLDDTGRGMQVVQGTTGLETVLAQGITVESRPCVLLLQIPVPRGLQSEGDADAFARTLHQMQEDLRHDNVTGAYNAVYLNEGFRPIAEHAAMNGQPVGAVMVRVNEYWQLREHESASAADCCLNMAAGILHDLLQHFFIIALHNKIPLVYIWRSLPVCTQGGHFIRVTGAAVPVRASNPTRQSRPTRTRRRPP